MDYEYFRKYIANVSNCIISNYIIYNYIVGVFIILAIGCSSEQSIPSNQQYLPTISSLVLKYGQVNSEIFDKRINIVLQKLLWNKPFPNVIVLHSSLASAGTAGGGVIVITDLLLEKLSKEDELAFVLAHEIGHMNLSHHKSNKSRYDIELEADLYAKKLLLNAGFSLKIALGALEDLDEFSVNSINSSSQPYPSVSVRRQAILSY